MPVRRFKKGTYDRYFRKSRRGKFSRRRGARSFQSRVKRVLMKATETKHTDLGLENQQLYHNLGAGVGAVPPTGFTSLQTWFDPWSLISQGTSRFERIGDKITPRGMSIKLFLASKFDRPNTSYRIIVCTLPKVYNGVVTGTTFRPFETPNLFGVNNALVLHPDTDKGVKFLYDRIVTMNTLWPSNAGTNKEFTKTVRLWIKRKRARDIVFDQNGLDIINKPLAVYVLPYEQFSTLQTDNIASCAGYMRLYYKDV